MPREYEPNGRRWLIDTWGKAVGSVIGALILGLLAFIATGKAATIYGLPPRVDATEQAIRSLQVEVVRPHPMTSPEIDALAAAIVQALPKKGKP